MRFFWRGTSTCTNTCTNTISSPARHSERGFIRKSAKAVSVGLRSSFRGTSAPVFYVGLGMIASVDHRRAPFRTSFRVSNRASFRTSFRARILRAKFPSESGSATDQGTLWRAVEGRVAAGVQVPGAVPHRQARAAAPRPVGFASLRGIDGAAPAWLRAGMRAEARNGRYATTGTLCSLAALADCAAGQPRR